MRKMPITTPHLADTMHMLTEQVHQMLTRPEFQSFRPDRAVPGKHCRFNERQTLLMLLAGDLVRWGVKAPLAGKIAARAAEVMFFDANAASLNIEFHANGASFTFTSPDAPDAASAAGPARFRLTFDLTAYRAAVDAAMTTQPEEVAA